MGVEGGPNRRRTETSRRPTSRSVQSTNSPSVGVSENGRYTPPRLMLRFEDERYTPPRSMLRDEDMTVPNSRRIIRDADKTQYPLPVPRVEDERYTSARSMFRVEDDEESPHQSKRSEKHTTPQPKKSLERELYHSN